MFLAPAVGMRLWAEEQRTGTIELLLTMPISVWHAIVGKFLAAFDHKASDKNERMEISIDTKFGSIIVKQIAGLVARRIFCYAKKGEKITIAKLAKSLKCTPRTIHRRMCVDLKKTKEELNEEINI